MNKLGLRSAWPKSLSLHGCLVGCLLFSPSWCRGENLSNLNLEQIRSRAEQGDPEAQYQLGKVYSRTNQVVAQNLGEAVEWFSRAARQGNIKAMADLGAAYDQGLGVRHDPVQAEKWTRLAAEHGDAIAQYNLGTLLLRNKSKTNNFPDAIEWLTRAAEAGQPNAQARLGEIYYWGDAGVEKNPAEAARWLVKAAEQGIPSAQNALGVLHETGLGVKKDLPEAAAWFRRAAEQGDPKAQSNLGRLYWRGIGVERDPVQSCLWLKLAAAKGEVTAINLLEELKPAVTTNDLAEAERLSGEYLARRRAKDALR